MQVEKSQLQIDTVKFSYVSFSEVFCGELQVKADTVYANFGGRVKFFLANKEQVKTGDTVLMLERQDIHSHDNRMEIQQIEDQHNDNSNGLIYDYLLAEREGVVKYLVKEDMQFKPGTPLFRIESYMRTKQVVFSHKIPSRNWSEKVHVIGKTARFMGELTDNANGTKSVSLIENIDSILCGQSVKVMLKTRPEKKLLLKKIALNYDEDKNWVFCKKGKEFLKIPIKVRPYNGAMIEIISGIHENDQIIVSSSLSIWNKDRLKIVN